jgi:hypothetical protein
LLVLLFYFQNKKDKELSDYYAGVSDELRTNEKEVENKISTAYDKISSDFATYLPGIVCWGDSLTVGAGGDGTNYPKVLKSLIDENLVDKFDAYALANAYGAAYLDTNIYSLDSVTVVNEGVGGETTNTILGRNGAVPFVLDGKLTIPSGTSPVVITFRSENGKSVAPLRQGGAGVNPVTIAGIEGTLSIEQESYISKDYTYYFTRSEAGDEVTVDEGTEINTSASSENLDYIPVVFIGQNGGYDDIDDLIAQQRAIINHQTLSEENQGKFIIVGLHTGTAQDRSELEAAMLDEYGDQYINLREYMSTSGLEDAGIEATEEDKEMMKDGMTPTSLMVNDKLHFNSYGYELIGNLIYQKMDELGYFDEIKEDLAEDGLS